MQNLVKASVTGIVLLMTAAAQEGHYQGTITTPNGALQMSADIQQNNSGVWTGSSAITPGPSGILLDNITVNGANVSWSLRVPGTPNFKGTWSKETSTIKGTLNAPSGSEVPIEFKRTGEAKVDLPPASTPVSKEIEGKWVGSITPPNGQTLRLELDLSNAGGKGNAVLTSVDQGGAKMTADSVTQNGQDLSLQVRAVGAKINGKVSADHTSIDASLDQSGASLPLKLTRPAPPPSSTVK
jgi:hypothetical protein